MMLWLARFDLVAVFAPALDSASPMATPRTKVLLIDDHPIVFLALKALLECSEDFELCPQGPEEGSPLDLARAHRPGLVILDLMLDGRNGLELVPALLRIAPEAGIVVYSSLEEMRNAPRALRAGAMGYVLKKAPPSVLLEALYAVRLGKRYVSEAVQQLLISEAIVGARSAKGVEELSNQQLQVFRLLGEGLQVSEVATKLGVSIKTIHSHRERIKNKLNLHSGAELQKSAEHYYRGENLDILS